MQMRNWIVQLVVSPAFERMDSGSLIHEEIEEDGSEIASARYWKSDVEYMEWSQEFNFQEAHRGVKSDLSPDVAKAILQSVRSAKVCAASQGDFGYIHPTRFQLKVMSGFNISTFLWVHELPVEWSELNQSVQLLRTLGETPCSTC